MARKQPTYGPVPWPLLETDIASKGYVDQAIQPGPVPPTEGSSLWWQTMTRKLGSWSEALIWTLATFVSEGDERLGSFVSYADTKLTFIQWGFRSYGTTYPDQEMQLLLTKEPSNVLYDATLPAGTAAKSSGVDIDMGTLFPDGVWWDVSPPAGGTPPSGAPSDWVLAINMRFEYTPPSVAEQAARVESLQDRIEKLESKTAGIESKKTSWLRRKLFR